MGGYKGDRLRHSSLLCLIRQIGKLPTEGVRGHFMKPKKLIIKGFYK